MQGNMGQRQMYSTTDFMRLVIKIFGLIAIILIGISLAVPWAGYAITGTPYSLNLNGWGASTDVPAAQAPGFFKYLSDPFYINAMQSGITEGLVAGVFLILVFIFAIITLLIGLNAWRSIGSGGINKYYLIAGIFAIVTMVLCIIGVAQASTYGTKMWYQQAGYSLDASFGFSWGFIFIIIAMIFFFINYGINFYMVQQGMTLQRAQPHQQQPQMMYTSQQPPQQPPTQQAPPPPSQQTKQPPIAESSCPKCGAQMQAGVKFCPACGAKI